MKERWPFKEDIICHSDKWTTADRGILYLREVRVLEVINNNLNDEPTDPVETKCTLSMWQKLLPSAQPSYGNLLAVVTWGEGV